MAKVNTPFQPTIIGNEKALMAFIKSVHEYGSKYEVRAQAAVVSSLHFLALHGRAEPMNALFEGLRPAYQTAVKLFVQAYCGHRETVTNEAGDEINRFVSWLKHTNKDGWFINKNEADKLKAKPNRDEWSSNPGQFMDKKFYETKVEGVRAAFTDLTILKTLDNLIKQAGKDDSKASASIKSALLQARKDIGQAAQTKAA